MIKEVIEAINKAEQAYHREPDSVQLLAASKTRTADEIWRVFESGQRVFGESYAQEAVEKIEQLKDLPIEWHFIGPIQSNKTKLIANHFSWVHSIDREKIADRLNEQRSPDLPPLNVCIEVNISGETSKSGVDPSDVIALAQKIVNLPHLKLRGLMAIPAPTEDFEEQRAVFRRLKQLFDELNQQGFELDTLSMGMSDDYVAAIAEGATIVRIGTAIFGPRI